MKLAGLICAVVGHDDVITEVLGDLFLRGETASAYLVDEHCTCTRCGRVEVRLGGGWNGVVRK